MKKSRAEKSLEALLDKANEKETLAEAEVRIRQLLHEEARTLARQCTIHRQEVQDALEPARAVHKGTHPAPEQVECLECGASGTADERACFCSEHGEAYDTTQREET